MKIDPVVLDILTRSTVAGNRLDLPPGQLDRKVYERVAKVLELLGGEWVRRERAHIFDEPAEDVVADAITTGEAVDHRKAFQFFETPAALASRLVEMAGVEPGQRVLEPSAGRGRIVDAIRRRGVEPVACELWEKNRAALAAAGVELIGDDFLRVDGIEFDRIIANPPFTRGQDVDHVSHMWRLLRPGGRLVSVMSPGWTFRRDRRHTEFAMLAERVGAKWNRLDAGAFAESGTAVSAGVIVMERAA